MCGLFCVVQRGQPIDRQRLTAALRAMGHRGPDADGSVFIESNFDGRPVHIGFGHVRLSIIDPGDRSDQPFDRHGTTLVFNGEIYNYKEVRSTLDAREDFSTDGDTEVLSEVLRAEGPDAVRRLSGQWAFVFYETGSRTLRMSRDRAGKKPLFLYQDRDMLIVSSTIRAISVYRNQGPSFNRDYLQGFLIYPQAPLPTWHTSYSDILQVPTSTNASFDLSNWTLTGASYFEEDELVAPDPDERALAQCLERAVQRRLVSDRPVGLLLSGGVDSTLILSILKHRGWDTKITCFVGDAGGSPDADYAVRAARTVGLNPVVVPIDYDRDAFNRFMQSCAHQERPFRPLGNLLAIPQLYEAIAETSIKVVLDGTGGDETFGGYWDRYFGFAVNEAIRRGDWPWLLSTSVRNLPNAKRYASYLRRGLSGAMDRVDPITLAPFGLDGATRENPDVLARIHSRFGEALCRDIFNGRLQDWLWQNDRNCMMYGIEARSPFLDAELLPYLRSGYRRKFKGPYNKYELRAVFDRFVPLPTQWRTQKQGFRWSPERFMQSNRTSIIDLCGNSGILRETIPKFTNVIDAARTDDTVLASPVFQRMASIAGVEHALTAR